MVKNTKLKPRHIIAKNIQQHGKKIKKKKNLAQRACPKMWVVKEQSKII